MKHENIDEFASGSPLLKIDPRTKLVALIVFLIVAAFAVDREATLCLGAVSIILAAVSKIPVKHIIRNLLFALPFIIAVSLGALIVGDIIIAIFVSIRIAASVLTAVIFASTTPVFEQIRALQYFRVPTVITSMLLFTYRFIFVFIDELERMKLARVSRSMNMQGGTLLSRRVFKTIGQTLGMLFIRVNERAKRVFFSLRARGYTGKAVTRRRLAFGIADISYAIFMSISIFIIMSIQLGVIL
ncbi:MAG: energy-coupling factor transporter transmembrane protein EcfT [Thermoplasmata archaeon]|nr:energy-coupling factor transporter transmembrane protein EcfT [Thermoplasmata archaeon]